MATTMNHPHTHLTVITPDILIPTQSTVIVEEEDVMSMQWQIMATVLSWGTLVRRPLLRKVIP